MIRISSLPRLLTCPGWWLLDRREPRPSGPAADTGTLAGAMISAFHAGGGDAERAIRETGDPRNVEWVAPLADVPRAAKLAALYAADTRLDHAAVVPGSCEMEVSYQLGAYQLVGHLDQVRADPAAKCFRVWDVKSGWGGGGAATLHEYAAQLAGYTVAVDASWGARNGGAPAWPVQPGGIIHLPAYERSDERAPVLFACQWDRTTALDLVGQAQTELDALVGGRVRVNPGRHCAWCPAGNVGVCTARFRAQPAMQEEIA